jgi:hypothetical protein
MVPGNHAGLVTGQAVSADIRARFVDCARRFDANVSIQGCAAIAIASHAAILVIYIGSRYPGEGGRILE